MHFDSLIQKTDTKYIKYIKADDAQLFEPTGKKVHVVRSVGPRDVKENNIRSYRFVLSYFYIEPTEKNKFNRTAQS